MKNTYKHITNLFTVLFIVGGLGAHKLQSQNSSALQINLQPQNDRKLISEIEQKARQLLQDNNYTAFDELQAQKFDRIEENSEVVVDNSVPEIMKGHQIYPYLKERTVLVGPTYLCKSCPKVHLNNASGYVIHESGVIVTNYHVIEPKPDVESSAIFVSDHQGNVYPVIEILATSQSNDLAILRVNTKGKKLKYLPLAKQELIGEDIYVMGHSFKETYYMTKGIIARKYISDRDAEVKMAVTAEYGQGGSGGPIVNTNGQLVGMVSATLAYYSKNSKKKGDLQLVVRQSIPVSVINNYVKVNNESNYKNTYTIKHCFFV